jgi:hypothetical protein
MYFRLCLIATLVALLCMLAVRALHSRVKSWMA